jgi:hypothetical protein
MTRSNEIVCKKAKEGLTSFAQFESLSFRVVQLFCFDFFLVFKILIWCINS